MFSIANHSKSIDFLLENAGPVIRYRLRKEILRELPDKEEGALLEEIYQMPLFQLLKTYVKPNGYIGRGMHSWDHWRGQTLHETPLQDGESAARLLSYYRIPKDHPIVKGFVAAVRDEAILKEEFSYIPPEIPRFEQRMAGMNNGNSLMALIDALQAMLGYGDDYEDLKEFQQTALKGFCRVKEISSLEEITQFKPEAKRKYNYPYIEADEYFPNVYTTTMLAYTKSWRNQESIKMLADSLNHINAIMKPDANMHVRLGGKYAAPCFALCRPIRPFHPDRVDVINYRRFLSELAMLGVGERVDVLRESAANVEEALRGDGILRLNFVDPQSRRAFPKQTEYPAAYTDVRLEASYQNNTALLCDLTFWAIEFLFFLGDNAE